MTREKKSSFNLRIRATKSKNKMLGFFMLAEPDANQSEALNLVTSDLSYLFVGTDKASENRKRITTLFPFFIIRRVSEQPSSNCLRENKTNKSVFRHPSSGEYLF